ncbi:hypothetical protein [Parendozoicomonas haliclonae]|uniref:Uncharacterized protein n=1 Tax=Parendozoicomonas haliclonae TaxID=1960125 RepID=A0A1X7AG35_9GAMM|nr:hypothetical protein [Parendozoicomonas haliclonae]SMA39178.1 hypothetical protein EHSB41UT_00983 [Parendozoicomonas haliclonae]
MHAVISTSKVLLLSLSCLFILNASAEPPARPKGNGVVLFKFNKTHWLEIVISGPRHPTNAIEIQDQANQEKRELENEKDGSQPFPEELDFIKEIKLKYVVRFK